MSWGRREGKSEDNCDGIMDKHGVRSFQDREISTHDRNNKPIRSRNPHAADCLPPGDREGSEDGVEVKQLPLGHVVCAEESVVDVAEAEPGTC